MPTVFTKKVMSRTEVLNSWFFPCTVRKNGIIYPAPDEAVIKMMELRNNWLKTHPDYPHEEPVVSLGIGEKEGKEGYFVRTEIMYIGKKGVEKTI